MDLNLLFYNHMKYEFAASSSGDDFCDLFFMVKVRKIAKTIDGGHL